MRRDLEFVDRDRSIEFLPAFEYFVIIVEDAFVESLQLYEDARADDEIITWQIFRGPVLFQLVILGEHALLHLRPIDAQRHQEVLTSAFAIRGLEINETQGISFEVKEKFMAPISNTTLAYEDIRSRVERQPLLNTSLVDDHVFQIQLVERHLQLLTKLILLVSCTRKSIAEIVVWREVFLVLGIARVDVERLLRKMREGCIQYLVGVGSPKEEALRFEILLLVVL